MGKRTQSSNSFYKKDTVKRIGDIDVHITEADAYGKDDKEYYLLNKYNKNGLQQRTVVKN